MKLVNKYLFYKTLYKETLILIENGSFFCTFNEDAIILNYLFDYKIIDNKVGFPISIENKIKLKLNALKIDYTIIKGEIYFNNTFKKCNSYLKIKNDAILNMETKEKIKELYKLIASKIDEDNYNFERIKSYVYEL